MDTLTAGQSGELSGEAYTHEIIGLADFLRQHVPGITSPGCPRGWHRQTAKHAIMFYPLQEIREQLPRVKRDLEYTTVEFRFLIENYNVKPDENGPAWSALGPAGATLPAIAKPRVLAAPTERGHEGRRIPLSGHERTGFHPP